MLRPVAVVVLLALPMFASAQSDSSARRRGPLCWRGKPEPLCGSFWITEVTGEYAFVTTQTHYRFVNGNSVDEYSRADVSSQVLWTVGPMFNTSPTRALGGTVSAGFVQEGSRIALETRRRYWITPGGGIDLSAGLVRANVPPRQNQFQQPAYGATAGMYVGGGDLIHVNARADLLLTGGRIRAGSTAGGGFGGPAAIGATVVAGTLILLALVSALHGGDF